METLLRLDTDLFLWLNGLYADWLDPVMVAVTNRYTWFPFYALLIGWLVYVYRRQAVALILTLLVGVILSDQVTSSVLKPLTMRLRPCHVPELQKLIHPVLECGGLYGFASSHAANSFALAMGTWLLLGRRYPAFRWLFLWAFVVSYSRIYVGAHYPSDILAGALIGMLCAWVAVWLIRRITASRKKAVL